MYYENEDVCSTCGCEIGRGCCQDTIDEVVSVVIQDLKEEITVSITEEGNNIIIHPIEKTTIQEIIEAVDEVCIPKYFKYTFDNSNVTITVKAGN